MSKIKPSLKPDNAIDTRPDISSAAIKAALAALGLLCILSTVVFDKTREMSGTVFSVMSLTALLLLAGFLLYEKKLNTQNAALLIMAAGFVIRLDYVIYTPLSETVRVRQHDLFAFGGTKGHSAYIEHFYNNGFSLPNFDPTTRVQFYHPPLHHLLAAMWMRILTTFGMSYSRAVGSLQFLTLFYSSCCMLVSERIFTKLRINGLPKLLAISIVAFHPTFIILAGSVNNDILSILFILLSVYSTLVWYEDPTVKNILYIALSIGLGMSTKLSAALVAIPIALVFLIKLISDKKNVIENIRQFCIFGTVCLPLGLWFSIRNNIRFKVPFTYVQRLSEESDQYIGDKTVFERLFDFSYHPFENVFLNRIATGADFYEYNPFVAIVKTSLFGEYCFKDIAPYCRILLIMNIIMIVLSLAATLMFVVKKSKQVDKTEKIFLVFFQILMFVYYIKFCFDFPHNCSMDYRYIVPTCILGALFIGASLQQFEIDNGKKKALTQTIRIVVTSCVAIFCLSSIFVYIALGA